MRCGCLGWSEKRRRITEKHGEGTELHRDFMKLSIIIVSWNVCALLRTCLQSVYANADGLDLQVIVVDSASGDETIEMVSADFPQTLLLPQTENVGFPRGNNIGLAHATGDHILFLNPDTEIIGDALQTMVAYMEINRSIGMLGPQLLNTDGSHQSSRRRFPTLLTGIFESTWLQPYAPRGVLQRYYVEDSADDETALVDWVNGAAMLTRRAVVEQVGGMDVSYFMYSEELDYCRRIKDVGWDIVYLPTAKITHHYGKSSEQAVTYRHINFNRAKLRYFRKFEGRVAYFIVRFVLLTGFVGQILIEGIKYIVGHRRNLRRQRIRSYLSVVYTGLRAAGY